MPGTDDTGLESFRETHLEPFASIEPLGDRPAWERNFNMYSMICEAIRESRRVKPMQSHSKVFNIARMTGIITLLAICSSACAFLGPKVETASYQTDDGAILVETVVLTATVTAIDQRARTLTINPRFGDEQTVVAPPEMVNFDQINVGDEVRAEIIEETVVALVPGGAAESVGAAEGIALSPIGDKPAIGVVSSREVTADVIGIDAHAHEVSLEFIDGSMQTVKVGKHIDLSKVSLQDSVRIVVTNAVAIDFQKKK
jgi:hypothetical protein